MAPSQWQNRARLRAAQQAVDMAALSLDAAADALDDIRLSLELRAATGGAAWEGSPAGQGTLAALGELRDRARALREAGLPDVSGLRRETTMSGGSATKDK